MDYSFNPLGTRSNEPLNANPSSSSSSHDFGDQSYNYSSNSNHYYNSNPSSSYNSGSHNNCNSNPNNSTNYNYSYNPNSSSLPPQEPVQSYYYQSHSLDTQPTHSLHQDSSYYPEYPAQPSSSSELHTLPLYTAADASYSLPDTARLQSLPAPPNDNEFLYYDSSELIGFAPPAHDLSKDIKSFPSRREMVEPLRSSTELITPTSLNGLDLGDNQYSMSYFPPMTAVPMSSKSMSPTVQTDARQTSPMPASVVSADSNLLPASTADKIAALLPPQDKFIKISKMTPERIDKIRQLAIVKDIHFDTVDMILQLYNQHKLRTDKLIADDDDGIYINVCSSLEEESINNNNGNQNGYANSSDLHNTANSSNPPSQVNNTNPVGSSLTSSASSSSSSKPNYIKRPLNSFMLYRKTQTKSAVYHARLAGLKLSHQNISQIIGLLWQTESAQTKTKFQALANNEKEIHKIMHPGYKFCPQKKISKRKPLPHLDLSASRSDMPHVDLLRSEKGDGERGVINPTSNNSTISNNPTIMAHPAVGLGRSKSRHEPPSIYSYHSQSPSNLQSVVQSTNSAKLDNRGEYIYPLLPPAFH